MIIQSTDPASESFSLNRAEGTGGYIRACFLPAANCSTPWIISLVELEFLSASCQAVQLWTNGGHKLRWPEGPARSSIQTELERVREKTEWSISCQHLKSCFISNEKRKSSSSRNTSENVIALSPYSRAAASPWGKEWRPLARACVLWSQDWLYPSLCYQLMPRHPGWGLRLFPLKLKV